jgi:hypothetical protein
MVRIDVRKAISQERLRAGSVKREDNVNSAGIAGAGGQGVAGDGLDALRHKLSCQKPISQQASQVATEKLKVRCS